MKTRFAGLILALLFAAVACGAWLYVAERVKVADVAVSFVQQPQEEVVVLGYLNNPGASAFSMEKLRIEEPGGKPYDRQVSLDADRKFELVLGKPKQGAYKVSVLTKRAPLVGDVKEDWLTLPELTVDHRGPKQVRAVDYDDRSVALFAAAVAVCGAAACYAWFRRRPAPQAYSSTKS